MLCMHDVTSQRRLVVADVDGTVVGESGIVSPAAVAAVARARAAGWHVALATGRMIERARPIATQLAVPVVICTEGSVVYSVEDERPLVACGVRPSVVAQVLGVLQAGRWEHALATTELLYTQSLESAHLFAPWADTVQPMQDRDADSEVVMLVVLGPYEEIQQLHADWRTRFGDSAQLVLEHTGALPDGGLVKVLSPRSDKGQSALWLAESLGLAGRDIVAFGDWLNDIPLLTCAALSVVPDNAIPEVKALADRVSDYGVEHDFFARELNLLLDERANEA
jgi:Cof subfamily protein (haloacid dehalogenase superfamily)